MKRIAKFGCLGLLAIILIGGGLMWYFAPEFPVTVTDPGAGGERLTLNDRPANFFPGKGAGPRPAIIFLGGSEGGLTENANDFARRLAARGFTVIYPGYYRTSDATKDFDAVPLDTIEAALDYLRADEKVDRNRIGMIGGSKGAEGALLFAARHPDIRAVVATMPSSVVWQGFSMESMDQSGFGSSWSVSGKDVAYLPYTMPPWTDWLSGDGIYRMYAGSLAKRDAHPDAIVRVEDIGGPVLLICGEQDTLWPSCDMSRQLTTRAERLGGPEVRVLAYKDAGHAVFGNPRATTDKDFDALGSMGGSPEGNNAARKDNLPKIMAFLESALATP